MTIFNFNVLALMVSHIIRLFKNQFRTAQGSNSMVNAERDHNSRGLGTEPQWGYRGHPAVGAQGEQSPLNLNVFLFSRVQRKLQICPIIDNCKSQ